MHLYKVLKDTGWVTEKDLAMASQYKERTKAFADCLRRAMDNKLIVRKLWIVRNRGIYYYNYN